MNSKRSAAIAARFGCHAQDYDRHASLQARVARRLATFLPAMDSPQVLEIGCGTGLFTQHLLARYETGDFLITDLAPEMVEATRARFERRNDRALRFAVMDGEALQTEARFDVIALSMTLQWLADPLGSLERLRGLLRPGGTLLFATIGPECFPEWRAALASDGLADGIPRMPALPHVIREEHPLFAFEDGFAFLQRLKGIGATMPRPGYRPLSAGALRSALRRLDEEAAACVTWHIVYGRCEA